MTNKFFQIFAALYLLIACTNGSSKSKDLPQKIVSLTVASDEILYALLEEKGELNRIAALSSFSNDSKYSNIAEKSKKIKNKVGSQIESILQLKPDLIIAAKFTSPNLLTKLSQLKLNHLKLESFSNLGDIKKNINLIANATGTHSEATKLIESLETIKPIKFQKSPHVLNYNPSGYIMGQDTIITDLLKKMGIENVVKESGWPKITPEKISTLNPDYIIASGNVGDLDIVHKQLSAAPGWSSIPAVKYKKIILVPEKDLSSASHFIVNAYSLIKSSIISDMKK